MTGGKAAEEEALGPEAAAMFAIIDRWVKDTSTEPPPVEPGSPLAGDARKSPSLQVAYAAWAGIVHSVDHLHALRALVGQAQTLNLGAPYTLMRSAMANLPESFYEAMAADGFFDLPPAVLARLALSQAARELADRARSLVPTASDSYSHGGEFVEHAAGLVAAAQYVLERAVVYERERSRSWETIGEALGITRKSAHERFAEAEERWQDALDRPCVMDRGIANSNLPDGADSPKDYTRWLDEWCERHHEPADPGDVGRQVSVGLVDEEHRTLQLSSAVLAQSSRLLSRPGGGAFGLTPHPVAERTLWERKLRLAEALVAERPEDSAAHQMVADAQTKLAELRRSALHVVPEA